MRESFRPMACRADTSGRQSPIMGEAQNLWYAQQFGRKDSRRCGKPWGKQLERCDMYYLNKAIKVLE